MKSEAEKKVDFIVAWYQKERSRFSFAKQVVLAKTWIGICTNNEEYEMAAALQKEKDKVIKEYLKNKRKSRTWQQRFRYYLLKIMRKFKK